MPRQYDLTWVKNRSLWRKVYKGHAYTVSCKQLAEEYGPVPENKEGSYRFAKSWWAKKKAEVDADRLAVPRVIPRGHQIALATLGLPRGVWEEWLALCEEEGTTEPGMAMLQDAFNNRHLTQGDPLHDDTKKLLGPDVTRDIETIQKLYQGQPQAPADRSVEHFKGEWLRKKKAEVVPDRYSNYERWLAEFVNHVGAAADVNSINAGTLDSFYTFCREQTKAREHDEEKGWSAAWAKDVFTAARSFVRWLSDTEKIPPPRNLTHRFRFDVVPEEPDPWTVEEVKTVLGLARGPLRLYLLLALNCGYGSKDIADLRTDEVDLKAGVIDRYRSKAKKYKSRRKLAFALWQPTLALLREYAGRGERLLTTEHGTPLRGDGRRDNIAMKFASFRERHVRKVLPGFSRTFYTLRSTSATLIGQQFGLEYARYFLNQSPKAGGVAEVHYVKLSPEKLAEAVLWLGRQLGLVEPE